MGLGEPSMLEGATRTAFVRADRACVCWVMKRSAFEALGSAWPELAIRLLRNLLRSATRTMGRLSVDVVAERP
jgi:CRP-like cAMP-binding protein